MINLEMIQQIQSAISTFKKVMPEKYSLISKTYDVLIILLTFAKRESGFNFTALNPSANDYGLYQFIPSTLESTIKLYQTKPDQIEIIKKNFKSTDQKTAVVTQTFVMLNLLYEYAKNNNKEVKGYYKYVLDSITDIDLKNIFKAYLQHAGGGLIFTGKQAKNYEMITTLVDVLNVACNMYKNIYKVTKTIDFDVNKIYEQLDATTAGTIKAINKTYSETLKKEGLWI